MRIFLFLLLLTSVSFASSKSILVVAPNVNYKIEPVAEFSELLYDTILNSLAQYNFKQALPSNMFFVKDKLILNSKKAQYIQSIQADSKSNLHEVHSQIKNEYKQVIIQNRLTKLLVLDFNTKKVLNTLKHCKKICLVKVSFHEYTIYKKPIKKIFDYQYDAQNCILTQDSTHQIDIHIEEFLNN